MIEMRVKTLFFDTPRVRRAVGAATRAALSKAGAFIRTTARHSIRKRKGVSEPGSPPHSHEGSLRRLIFFAYEPTSETVVIGPVRFRAGEAPPLLEFGGAVTRKDRRGRARRLRYEKRPFMGPALQKELPQLPRRWRNSVRG